MKTSKKTKKTQGRWAVTSNMSNYTGAHTCRPLRWRSPPEKATEQKLYLLKKTNKNPPSSILACLFKGLAHFRNDKNSHSTTTTTTTLGPEPVGVGVETFCRGPRVSVGGFTGLPGLCNYSVQLWRYNISHRQHMNEWAWGPNTLYSLTWNVNFM